MESRAILFGQPIHQMLIAYPLGVLAMSLVFDLIARFSLDAPSSLRGPVPASGVTTRARA
jgi:hypothetical protein